MTERRIGFCKRCDEATEHTRGCVPCRRRRDRERYARDSVKVLARNARARAFRAVRDPGYRARRSKREYELNPAAHRERAKRYTAWLNEGDVTGDQLRALWAASNGRCHYCGEEPQIRKPQFGRMPVGFDHVIPRAKGGRHTISNMVVCCLRCNMDKGTKVLHGHARAEENQGTGSQG